MKLHGSPAPEAKPISRPGAAGQKQQQGASPRSCSPSARGWEGWKQRPRLLAELHSSQLLLVGPFPWALEHRAQSSGHGKAGSRAVVVLLPWAASCRGSCLLCSGLESRHSHPKHEINASYCSCVFFFFGVCFKKHRCQLQASPISRVCSVCGACSCTEKQELGPKQTSFLFPRNRTDEARKGFPPSKKSTGRAVPVGLHPARRELPSH